MKLNSLFKKQISTFKDIHNIENSVYRNIIKRLDRTFYNDLSPNNDEQNISYRLSLSPPEQQAQIIDDYMAIEYIFQNPAKPGRFNDSTFPAWYGSLDIVTTFHESAFHWYKTYINNPESFKNHDRITGYRSVYSVRAKASLIDLRPQCKDCPELVDESQSLYSKSQRIGKIIRDSNSPGIISYSARHPLYENITVFQRQVLSNALHQHDYIYTFRSSRKTITVTEEKSMIDIVEISIK